MAGGTRAAVVLAALLSVLAAAAPAAGHLRLSGQESARERVWTCGVDRRAAVVSLGARVVARAPRRVVVERCRLGRWRRVSSAARRAVLPTRHPADLRVRSRGSRSRLVRVGVGEIVDVRVAFDVVNTNTSRVPCPTDGATYVIRGRLSAPAAALAAAQPAATLWLHGVDAAGYLHLRRTPQVDFARQLAARGRVAVTIDRLGYRSSDRPPGDGSCVGGQADTVHQALDHLRAGSHRAAGVKPVAFGRLALAGHSGGGPVAEAAAYSFPDIDALIVMAWADQEAHPPLVEGVLTGEGARCAADPSAYAYVFKFETWRRYPEARLHPWVLALAEAGRSPNPCGDLQTILAAPALDTANLAEVTVPVLLAHGRFDALFGDASGQRDLFRGSDDVTSLLHDGGHSSLLEDALAARVQDDVARWLADRGL